MSWNEARYATVKAQCKADIAAKRKTAYDYMQEYKKMIRKEDYEAAKAITEVLEPMNYDTADTHMHIRSIQPAKK